MKRIYLLIVLLSITSFSIAQVPQSLSPQPTSTEPAVFKAQLMAHNLPVSGLTEVAFDSVFVNTANAYDKKTGYYIAPYAGWYYFHVQLIWYTADKPSTVGFKIIKNSNSNEDVEFWTEISSTLQGAAFTATSAFMNLNVGDTVKVRANAAYGGSTTIGGYVGDSHFFGYKVY